MSLVRPYDQFVGIDIAAKTATVVIQPAADAVPSRPFVIEQTADGLATLQRSLRHGQSNPATTLVVLEATGSYWITLATTLHHAGYAVSVINPAQAHHFAKALLRRSKTDAIDAQTLARLAATLQPAPWTPPPAVYHELQQRLAQRDAWIAMRQQIRNQRHALTQQSVVVAAVVTRMDDLIATLDAQITEIEAELRPALAGDAGWEAGRCPTGKHQRHWPHHRLLDSGDDAQFHAVCHPGSSGRVRWVGATGGRVGHQCAAASVYREGWECSLTDRSVYGNLERGAKQPGNQKVLHPATGRW